MTPRLSVVIPAYNVERYVDAAVSSALAQTLREIEVVVVDDGSTDATPAILARFDDPRLRVVRKANGGLSSARNAGVLAARAPLIGFLDGDDLWHPEKAARHVAAMDADPGVGISFSHSTIVDESGVPTGRVLFSTRARPGLRAMIRRNEVGNGSTPVVRAECFLRAGLFDESLRSCEDWEMWVRILRDARLGALLVPEPLTYYRTNSQSLSMRYDGFVAAARLAAARIARETPGERAAVRRGLGTCYRVAGTKALRNGDRRAALRLFLSAVSACPWLPLVDPRLAACLAVMPLPPRVLDRVSGGAARALAPGAVARP